MGRQVVFSFWCDQAGTMCAMVITACDAKVASSEAVWRVARTPRVRQCDQPPHHSGDGDEYANPESRQQPFRVNQTTGSSLAFGNEHQIPSFFQTSRNAFCLICEQNR